jgi:hypothetical protein
MTLIEVLIAAGIIGMLMTVLTSIFIETIRIYYKTSARSELQGSVVSALGLITRELMETDARSVYPTYSSTQGISFLSSVPLNGTNPTYDPHSGKMEWKKYIIYYIIPDTQDPNTSMMIRREFDPNVTVPMTANLSYYNFSLTQYMYYSDYNTQRINNPTAPGNRLLTNGIKKLYITIKNTPTQKYASFDITIKKVVKNVKNEAKEAQYKTTIYFRNCL